MCLAIYKPKNELIEPGNLRSGFDQNPDGAGFAVAVDNTITIYKGFFTFEAFMEAFKPFEREAAIIHFRWATHGAINVNNCHPFSILNDKYAMIHNGILNIESTQDRSDTAIFTSSIIEPLLRHIDPADPSLKYLIENGIGEGNKLAILRKSGEAVLFHEAAGVWDRGSWYSNASYKIYKYADRDELADLDYIDQEKTIIQLMRDGYSLEAAYDLL